MSTRVRLEYLKQTLANNFVVQVAGKALSVVFGLISVGLLTRALGQEGFGQYTTAITFLQLFGVIVDFGLTLTLVVMISEPGVDEERVVGNIFGLRLITGCLVFGLSPVIVLAFPYSHTVKLAVLIGAFGYVAMAGAALLVGVFQKHAVVWRASLAEFVNRLVLVLLISVFFFLHLGVIAMIIATVGANIAWLLLTLFLARPLVKIVPRIDGFIWKKALAQSWPIALSIAFNLIYLKGDTLFLSLYRSPAEVGVYGLAYRVIDVLTVLPTIFMGLLLPSLVADWAKGGREEFGRHLARAFDVFAMIFLPVVIGAQTVAIPLTRLIAGKGFEESGSILRLLIVAVVGVFLGNLYGHAVVALKQQRRMMWGYGAVAVLSVIGYRLLIPPYGMWGAAAITIASESTIAFLTFLMVWKTSHVLPRLGVFFKALLSALAMALVLRLLPPMPVLAAILIGAIVYFASLLLTKAVSPASIKDLMPRKLAKHGG